MVWVKVAEKDAIPKNGADEVVVNGRKVAIINRDRLYALDALCAHQDQSITCGKVEGDVIECPHHFWHYNYKTGELLDYLQNVSLPTHAVEERKDGIYIDIAEDP